MSTAALLSTLLLSIAVFSNAFAAEVVPMNAIMGKCGLRVDPMKECGNLPTYKGKRPNQRYINRSCGFLDCLASIFQNQANASCKKTFGTGIRFSREKLKEATQRKLRLPSKCGQYSKTKTN